MQGLGSYRPTKPALNRRAASSAGFWFPGEDILVRAKIATWITVRRLSPLIPSPISRRLLATPLGRRAMTRLFNRRVDERTMPRGH